MAPKFFNICLAVLALLLGSSLTYAEEVVECPSVSLKKVYDKEGLCDGTIGDTASFRLKEALLKVGDSRIGIENCYIPDWSTSTSVVADGVSTYTFNYRLLDAENQVLQESCQAEMVVTDASKPSCPSSSLKLVVPVGPDCIAVAAEAVDFFEQEVDIEEKGRKPSCEGATLFASISAFKFYDEETHDEKDGGIFPDKTYDFNWSTDVPVRYRIAANQEFVNPAYCMAYVFVKDDVEITCPDNTDVTLSTGAEGFALLPPAKLVAPVACNPGAVSVAYSIKESSAVGSGEEVTLADLTARHLAVGSYTVSAVFSREVSELQIASQKTCTQVVVVTDGTKPVCPTVSDKGITLRNTVCGLDLDGVEQLVLAEIAKDKQLDNNTVNSSLVLSDFSGENEISADAAGLAHDYTFRLADGAGNSVNCALELSLVDDELPVCTANSDLSLVVTDACEATTSVELSGSDNCGIKKFFWWVDANQPKAYTGAVCEVSLTKLSIGEHTLYWRLMDVAGNQQTGYDGDYCSQKISVYDKHPVVVDCDAVKKSFATDDDCKMTGLLDSLPVPSAEIYSCVEKRNVAVPASSYVLDGVAYTSAELNAKQFTPGIYELTTIFTRSADGFLKESGNTCVQKFSVAQKTPPVFSGNMELVSASLANEETSSVASRVRWPKAEGCDVYTYSYKVGENGTFLDLTSEYIEAEIPVGETIISVVATGLNGQSAQTDLKLVVADTSATACDGFSWRGMSFTSSQTVALSVGSDVENVDTVKVLHLTVNPSKTSEFCATACDVYEWNGVSYSESGDYQQTLQTQFGCDSVVTLHLTIHPSKTGEFRTTACDVYEWNAKYTLVDLNNIKELNLLVIGNSFSLDAFQYVPAIAKSEGLKLNIVQISRGGNESWQISTYKNVIENNKIFCNVYQYDNDYTSWSVVKSGNKGTYSDAINLYDHYDLVVINQYSIANLNEEQTVQPSHELVDYLKTQEKLRGAKFAFFASPVYANGYSRLLECGFSSSQEMWLTQTNVNKKVLLSSFDFIIPANTAIENARTYGMFSGLGTFGNLSYDGQHLQEGLPCFISAITSLQTIVDKMYENSFAVKTSVRPSDAWVTQQHIQGKHGTCVGVSNDNCSLAYYCVRTAIEKPYQISNITANDANLNAVDSYTESGDYQQTLQTQFGCDSVVTLHLTVNPSKTGEFSATACDVYEWNGVSYSESGDYQQTLQTQFGCDSVVTLHLTIHPSKTGEFSTTVCDVYEWNGETYTESGDYQQTLQTQFGCDSVVTLHLTVNPSKTSEFSATACDVYEWNGVSYSESGDYQQTLQTQFGCDSVVTLHLTVHPSKTSEFSATACDVYEWNGVSYSESGDYQQTLQTHFGCDSVVTLHLTIYSSKTGEFSATACDAYEWNGETYSESGDYQQTLQTHFGCDSVVTLHLTVYPSKTGEFSATACDAYEWNGETYTESGDYQQTLQTQFGCDSVVTLHLTVHPSKTSEFSATACDAYEWNGETYTESGDYQQTLQTQFGCDSVVTLHLTVHPSKTGEFSATACDVYEWNGEIYSESGDYQQTLQTQFGCDSVVTLHLTVYPSKTGEFSATACDVYEWNGETYTESGDYQQTLQTHFGCDSVVTLHLTVHPSKTSEFSATTCDAYEWNGETYTESGDYQQTLQTQFGCDSVVTLHLTVNPSKTSEFSATACDVYEWNGETYTESGDYQQTLQTQFGCDSVVTLHLTVNPSKTSEFSATACDAYEWNGETYTESGDYQQTLQTQFGCDSVVTLHLTVYPSKTSEFSATTCDAYEWNGETYTESGDYQQTLQTQFGCDSVVTLHLTVNPSKTSEFSATACDAYEWNGETYTESGDYQQTLQTQFGCDSVVTLHLTVHPSKTSEFSATACDAYEWNGETYTESGDYQQTLQTQFGCDSVVTLHLTVHPSKTSEFSATACDVYEWNGETYTESGDYQQTLQTQFGCDSVVTLHLTVNPSKTSEFSATVCDAYEWNGETYTESGDYQQTLQTQFGCDSVVTLHLTVGTPTMEVLYDTACGSFTWYGETYVASGVYTHKMLGQFGCDSVEVLYLQVNQPVRDTLRLAVCGDYVWHGVTYGVSGVYDYTDVTVAGCDSSEVLVLTVNQPQEQPVYVYGCDNVYWRGKLYTENTDFSDTLKSVAGCDSVVNYHLVVNKSFVSTTDISACDSFEWRGRVYTESGVYTDSLLTIYGCDSILNLNLTINRSKSIEVDGVACDSFYWQGVYYAESGDYMAHLETTNGCDSMVVLHLTILPSYQTQTSVTSCGSFRWHNIEIEASGVYVDTLSSVWGCDSIVVLDATVGLPVDVVFSDSVLLGDNYKDYGFTISRTAIAHVGNYTFHHDLKSSLGCDSIVTLLLTVYKEPEIEVDGTSVEVVPVSPEGYGHSLTAYCVGDTVEIAFQLTSGMADSFAVSFSPDLLAAGFQEASGLLSEASPRFVIPESAVSGSYVAYLTLFSRNQQSEPIEIPFKVGLPSSIIERMWNDVVVCNRKGQDFVKYQWYKEGETLENATKQYYQDFETVVGTYGLSVWNSKGERLDVCPRTFGELETPYTFVVTPNPAKPAVPFEVLVEGLEREELAQARLFVYSSSGVLVNTVSNVGVSNSLVLHNSGTYTVILCVDGGHVATAKLQVCP